MNIYLAGPDVFLPDAIAIGRRKQAICRRLGMTGLFPLDNDIADRDDNRDVPKSLRIFAGNTAMMEAADAIVANLTPFRGPGADPGTVYELGFMAARGKRCAGYSNLPGPYIDRVPGVPHGPLVRPDQVYLDRDGLEVENFGLADNLMMIHALDRFGHGLLIPEAVPADPLRDLTLFEKCVRWIAAQDIRA